MVTREDLLRHPSAGAHRTASGVRCLHGCGVTFLHVDDWLAHLPIVHGHRAGTLTFSTPADAPPVLTVSTPPSPGLDGDGGTFPGGAA